MKKIMMCLMVGIIMFSSMVTTFAEEYVVTEGDRLWKIAEENNTTVSEIVKLNNIEDQNKIYVNQVIQIPEGGLEMTNKEKTVALIEV